MAGKKYGKVKVKTKTGKKKGGRRNNGDGVVKLDGKILTFDDLLNMPVEVKWYKNRKGEEWDVKTLFEKLLGTPQASSSHGRRGLSK